MSTDVYQMVLAEIEAPLLEEIMAYTRNNQTKASIMLGLNRGTLRKKLKQYDLISEQGLGNAMSDTNLVKVKRALISVSDKSGIVEFASALRELGVELLSTGGTYRLLQDNGLEVTEVADYTGFPEMMDGRVKTLHPKVHGGILARRGQDDAVMAEHGIDAIDMVVVNLYPFEATVARPDCSLEDAIENIDIGGPTMVRAAAKNHRFVNIVVNASDYADILDEMRANDGATSLATRFDLAIKAYEHTAAYDGAIANHFGTLVPGGSDSFPRTFNTQFHKVQEMRYGENPHQQAAFYVEANPAEAGIATARQIQGKELSYNNVADTDAALECVKNFDEPACVIVKHANPCGVAVADDIGKAYDLAFATDPESAFGGIIAFNRELDAATAAAIVERQFVEVIIAPSVSDDGREQWRRRRMCACWPVASGQPGAGTGLQARQRRPAGTGSRPGHDHAGRPQGRQQAAAQRAADARPAVRLESGQVRQIQRHHLRRQRPDRGCGRRPDEPHQLRPYRRHQGRARRPAGQGLGDGLRRLLPVPRRHRQRRRGGHCRGHPARGLDPR